MAYRESWPLSIPTYTSDGANGGFDDQFFMTQGTGVHYTPLYEPSRPLLVPSIGPSAVGLGAYWAIPISDSVTASSWMSECNQASNQFGPPVSCQSATQQSIGTEFAPGARPDSTAKVNSPDASQTLGYRCRTCSRQFTRRGDLNRHRECVHPPDGQAKPAYWCICGYSSPRKDNYKRHLHACSRRFVHAAYECKCGEQAENKQSHEDHIANCLRRYHLAGGTAQ